MAKPLLSFLFPEVSLKQPLSGQFAAKRDFLRRIHLPDGWGIDIEIVLEASKKGESIVEVNVGKLEHKKRDLEALSKTSRQVIKSILRKAGLYAGFYKAVIFEFEGVLAKRASKAVGGKTFQCEEKPLKATEINSRAELIKGVFIDDFLKSESLAFEKLPFAEETVERLKAKGYKVFVATGNFKETVSSLFPEKFHKIAAPSLGKDKNGIITGKVKFPRKSGKTISTGELAKIALLSSGIKPSRAIFVGRKNPEGFGAFGRVIEFSPESTELGKEKQGDGIRIGSLAEVLFFAN